VSIPEAERIERKVANIPTREASWPERAAAFVLFMGVLILAFFFLAAALVAGAILAGVILLRFWWIKRKLRKAADEEYITAEYTVMEREKLVEPPDAEKRG
jgi:predicted lipid-binding transport protein (Tim44 family)